MDIRSSIARVAILSWVCSSPRLRTRWNRGVGGFFGFANSKNLIIEETQEEILGDELLSFLFQLEIFEEVPGVGAISGALLNLAFIRRIDVTARRVFQERWLQDDGKVVEIAPAVVHERYVFAQAGPEPSGGRCIPVATGWASA